MIKKYFYTGFVISIMVFATAFVFNPGHMPDTTDVNKNATLLFYEEVFNKHNTRMIDSIVSSDYVEHQTDRHYPPNRKGLKKEMSDYFKGFEDAHITANFMMAENDLVTTQFTITGTHTGKIYGLNPSGKKIKIKGVDIIRYKDGKAIEHWGYLEEGKLLTQLGLIRELRNKE